MLITVVTPTYNEETNIAKVYEQVKNVFTKIKDIDYIHLFIDNNSKDNSQLILRKIAKEDKKVKVILNRSNYGHIRSPFHAIKQTNSDATIFLVCDLQDPPEVILEFIERWKKGSKLVVGVKKSSKENPSIFFLRKVYYKILNSITSENLQENFLGFGLYDREVVNFLKSIDDPEPYLRGIVIESGFEPDVVYYDQEKRKKGFTKNNFLTLYDLALIGITSYSKAPLRIIVLISFLIAFISFSISLIYLIYKLLYWNEFQLGVAPIIILFTFLFSIILFFLGIIGEYILSIHVRLRNRPLVLEKERINFD
ncbi:glycosyltransferase [Candidatus Pelagibacter sp.]|nr:glycosyltransferase [Candidatus Pelagibacter sp.]